MTNPPPNSESQAKPESDCDSSLEAPSGPVAGPISQWLSEKGLEHTVLDPDHIGIENIGIEASLLSVIASSLKENGFDYLQCQGGYDIGAGQQLVCFYHLIAMSEIVSNEDSASQKSKPREVRLKVFLDRDGPLKVPSLYKLFRGSD